MLTVEGTKVRFKSDEDGNQVSDDNGVTWYFTFRSEQQFREMWKNHPITTDENHVHPDDDRDAQLEVFGDTLDEPIPDDLADILLN